ncbi:hypothetical protein ACFWPH_09535 [Nocardia sp. NPDC058499]|uniref:hypothetical protein n=1 Tax=Nocardia sp. NPDC058499 TaxID=3346530 RepID=UPI00364B63E9
MGSEEHRRPERRNHSPSYRFPPGEAGHVPIRYNGYARQMLHSLREKPPSGMRNEVAELCDRTGLLPAA